MCLDILSGPHIARVDIPVWKVICKNNLSMYERFNYSKIGVNYPNVVLKPRKYMNYSVDSRINEGYHSYIRKSIANIIYAGGLGDYTKLKVIACTIPSGSEYYYGMNNDLVSSTIRINGNFFQKLYSRLKVIFTEIKDGFINL